MKRIQNNFFDDISSYGGTHNELRKRRHELMMNFPYCVKFTIEQCFSKQLKSVKRIIENKIANMTKICHSSFCDGIIQDDACIKCDTKYCDICAEIKEDGHTCNEEDILSKQFIQSMQISCPQCRLPIEKSSGCSYITCAVCDTKFDHTTGNISHHGGHSVKVEIRKENLVADVLAKFANAPKEIIDKIESLERFKLKQNKDVIKNFIHNEKWKAIVAYEKYLQEKKIHKEVLRKMEKIKNAQSLEEISMILK
jgi:LSD1 subclass zinc finger protein